jgi:hypothetical protein
MAENPAFVQVLRYAHPVFSKATNRKTLSAVEQNYVPSYFIPPQLLKVLRSI